VLGVAVSITFVAVIVTAITPFRSARVGGSAAAGITRAQVAGRIEAEIPAGFEVKHVKCTATSPRTLTCSGRFTSKYGPGSAIYHAIRGASTGRYLISSTVRFVFDHRIRGSLAALAHQ
jgi:hypothetical protein